MNGGKGTKKVSRDYSFAASGGQQPTATTAGRPTTAPAKPANASTPTKPVKPAKDGKPATPATPAKPAEKGKK